MPVVWAVSALVVPTMTDGAVDVPVAPGAPTLPSPVLATLLAVPAPSAAPVASTGRAAPAPVSDVAPMVVATFSVAVAPAATVQPATAPATLVETPVELSVVPMASAVLAAPAAPAVPAVNQSSSDVIVRDEKRVFTGYLPQSPKVQDLLRSPRPSCRLRIYWRLKYQTLCWLKNAT